MSEELQQKLRDQLWEVANRLRGNMSASDFMYFTLGFIFYKYLSEKIEKYANSARCNGVTGRGQKPVPGKYRLFYRAQISVFICDRHNQTKRKYPANAGTFFETHRGQYTWAG